MRAHEDRRGCERLYPACAQRAHPPLHEERLAGAALEEGRAYVEQERTPERQPDLPAEGLVIERRAPVEPLIETLRARHDDAIGRDAVKCDRLLTLRVVPHEYTIRNRAQNRLARQVVPAPHAERRRIAKRACSLQAIELRRRNNA